MRKRLPKVKSDNNKSSGLTLIELLVVFSVAAILAGFGIASYVGYSQSQEINQTAINIKLMINEAKFNALNVVKTITDENGNDVTCGTTQGLVGYRVDIVQPKTMRLVQICETSTNVVRSIVLPQTIDFDNITTTCEQIEFGSLSTLATGVSCEIVITGFAGTKMVSVDEAGNVNVE